MLECFAAEDHVEMFRRRGDALNVCDQPARAKLSRLREYLSFAHGCSREICSVDFGRVSKFVGEPAGEITTPAADLENAMALEILWA